MITRNKDTDHSVYIIKCLVNNKYYIGETWKYPLERIYNHISEAMSQRGYAFHSAIRRHGLENFILEKVLYCRPEEAVNLETKLINEYRSLQPNGYNILKGGNLANNTEGFCLGKTRSDETKKKISEAKTGTQVGENNPFYGKKHTIEVIEKLRINSLGQWDRLPLERQTEISDKISDINKERWANMSEEEKKELVTKIALSNKGKKRTSESIEKNRQAHLGKVASDTTKQKMSIAQTGKVRSPEHIGTYTQAQRDNVSLESKERIEKILELLHAGKRNIDIAKELNISAGYVNAVKRGITGKSVNNGIAADLPDGRSKPGSKERKEQILKLISEGVSQSQIALRFNCSKGYVSKLAWNNRTNR